MNYRNEQRDVVGLAEKIAFAACDNAQQSSRQLKQRTINSKIIEGWKA